MKKGNMNYGHPEELEKQRIEEMKSLSYVKRYEKLMVILELSFMMREAYKIQLEKINGKNKIL